MASAKSLRGRQVLGAVIALFFSGCASLPQMAQDPRYHGFADQRAWLGIPHAADVLSNLAFALVGAAAIARLVSGHRPRFAPATESGTWCIAVGLIATAAGSAWYHVEPSNGSLFWDRLPMTLVFAGVLGTALAQRVRASAARFGVPLLIVIGAATVLYWKFSGDLFPYMALQLGGILMLLALMVVTNKAGDPGKAKSGMRPAELLRGTPSSISRPQPPAPRRFGRCSSVRVQARRPDECDRRRR